MRYDRGVRYGQRGGYTRAEQERRERVRLRAAEWFEAGESTKMVAAITGARAVGDPLA